jgi:sugar phosphate permease
MGLRRTMLLAMGLIAAGYGLSTLATAYWQFVLLWGFVVGAGSGMAATVLGAAVATRWFTQRRGLVTGLLTASTATGQLIFLPSLAQMVTAHGWRGAPWVVCAGALAALPVIGFFMRDDPQDVGLRAYGEAQTETVGAADGRPKGRPYIEPADQRPALRERGDRTAIIRERGNPAKQAIDTLLAAARVRDFWLLAGSFFVCGASTNGLIGTHLVAAAFDCGIPEVRSASLLAMMGAFDLLGTTASGWLSDRFNCRYLLATYYGLRGLSLLFLPSALVGPSAGLMVFAMFYGLDWIATVPPTVRLTGEIFGRERAGIVFGWIVAAHQLGAAFAAYGAGWLRTTTGAYTVAFMAAGALCLGAAVGVLPVGRTRKMAPAAV